MTVYVENTEKTNGGDLVTAYQYPALQAENKKWYPEYKRAREKMIELLTAKNNVERIIGVTETEKNHNRHQEMR